ncbi:unnamed protein product [Prunus armeniaca]|uniref:Myb-like domain-containing protein n=1 Tax=Prunus armeniaca TaxID=36596 RepID=A0A6J5XQE1_PRUAR|nr:hypothetical protein GBA52_019856 [Prunus armeniaca]CAB4314392.1 unnamed protein product [Prunus armeniaca]
MPERDSIVNTPQQNITLRRSPRFLQPKNTLEPEKPPKTLWKSQTLVHREKSASESKNPRTPKSEGKSRSVVRSSSPSLNSKKSSKAHGTRKSPRLNTGVEQFQSLRRSSRILNRQRVVVDAGKDFPQKVSNKLIKFDNGSSNCTDLSSGSRKCGRKSLRFCIEQPVVDVRTNKATNTRSKSRTTSFLDKEEFSGVGKDGASVNSPEGVPKKSKKVTWRSSGGGEVISSEGRERKMQELDGGNKEVKIRRKRKRDEEGIGVVHGWTKEQELALQRAYLVAKPTPHFWKKVSKMVPGKSAQECFDRVHSEHITPPPPRTRSRAPILENSSPLGQFSLSASKLLKPTELKAKRSNCNKQRSHIAQKTVRKLLQKHHQVYQEYEADLFSVLEPSLDSYTESQPSVILSTPKNLKGKQGLLQKCSQRSSDHNKKPLSRFNSSSGEPLVSPPVLKQVRNRVWHDKYIDQLHNREAKRKAASTCTQKSTVQEVDMVRTAKLALVSEARDAINKLQHLQANTMENSSDLDEDGIVNDDEEGENDT